MKDCSISSNLIIFPAYFYLFQTLIFSSLINFVFKEATYHYFERAKYKYIYIHTTHEIISRDEEISNLKTVFFLSLVFIRNGKIRALQSLLLFSLFWSMYKKQLTFNESLFKWEKKPKHKYMFWKLIMNHKRSARWRDRDERPRLVRRQKT
jgi:hypothetical protein